MDSPTPAIGGLSAHPEVKKPNGLYCFQDAARPCGPDCMAFDDPPTHSDYRGKQWANCTVLVALHRGSKHLSIIAQTITPAAPGNYIQPNTPR